MGMPRIHLYLPDPIPIGPMPLPAAASHHLLRVLRARRGQALTLFCGDGLEYPAELIGVEGHLALVEVSEPSRRDTASPLGVILALPLLKGDRWDWVLQKACELGVAEIQPLHSRYSQVSLTEARSERRHQRWQEILIHAAEQSQATRLPLLAKVLPLTEFLQSPPRGLALVLDPSFPAHLSSLPDSPPTWVTVLTGPEGGLAPEELQSAAGAGWKGLRLGPRILRAETAPIAMLAYLQGRYGDLG